MTAPGAALLKGRPAAYTPPPRGPFAGVGWRQRRHPASGFRRARRLTHAPSRTPSAPSRPHGDSSARCRPMPRMTIRLQTCGRSARRRTLPGTPAPLLRRWPTGARRHGSPVPRYRKQSWRSAACPRHERRPREPMVSNHLFLEDYRRARYWGRSCPAGGGRRRYWSWPAIGMQDTVRKRKHSLNL